jgi:hypothetical protein
MSELSDYQKNLSDAIEARRNWLEKSELPKLKDDLRSFQLSFSSLYAAFLKKGLINEDPYKQEAKLQEIKVPSTETFPEPEKMEKMTIRLSDFDNQLDFLANFYQYSTDFLNLDRIKRILGLVKYIDWVHLSPDASSIATRYVCEFVNQVKMGMDPLGLSMIGESTSTLIKTTRSVTGYLKVLTSFNKEVYKLGIRTAITSALPEGETPTQTQIKKNFASAMPGKPFYAELVDDVIKEDYSSNGPALREAVLFSLKVAGEKKKAEKKEVSLKPILIDGIQSLGSVANTLVEVGIKLDENETLLSHKKLSFMEKLKRLFKQMANREPDTVIYELEYMDSSRGAPVRETVNYNNLRTDIDKRIRNLSQLSAGHGAAAAKLETLQESQLVGFLERNIRDLQSLHRTLAALDEYFKSNVDKADRARVKGIKPELATIKNAFIRANQKRHDYSAEKEEAEQFKKLGISVSEENT